MLSVLPDALRRVLLPAYRTASCKVLNFTDSAASKPTNGEDRLKSLLSKKFPDADVEVVDISGGCGSMYEIHVSSTAFKGLPMVKQHRLVQQALSEDIKNMHGIRVFTKAPS